MMMTKGMSRKNLNIKLKKGSLNMKKNPDPIWQQPCLIGVLAGELPFLTHFFDFLRALVCMLAAKNTQLLSFGHAGVKLTSVCSQHRLLYPTVLAFLLVCPGFAHADESTFNLHLQGSLQMLPGTHLVVQGNLMSEASIKGEGVVHICNYPQAIIKTSDPHICNLTIANSCVYLQSSLHISRELIINLGAQLVLNQYDITLLSAACLHEETDSHIQRNASGNILFETYISPIAAHIAQVVSANNLQVAAPITGCEITAQPCTTPIQIFKIFSVPFPPPAPPPEIC